MREEWVAILSYYIGIYWVGTIHGAQGPYTPEWYVAMIFFTGAVGWPYLINELLNVQKQEKSK